MTHSTATSDELKKENKKLRKRVRKLEYQVLRFQEQVQGLPTPRVQRINEDNFLLRTQNDTCRRLLKNCHDYLQRAKRIEWDGDWTDKPPHFLDEIKTVLKLSL